MRPPLEVADIFRAAGPAWRAAHAGHISLAQLKVMSAIETCRTAALGGHIEGCEECGHRRIAYNSCLMGKIGNGELPRPASEATWTPGQSRSPLRLAPEQCTQLVRRSEISFALVGRAEDLDAVAIFDGPAAPIDFGGRQIAVVQPQGDAPNVQRPLQHDPRQDSLIQRTRFLWGEEGPQVGAKSLQMAQIRRSDASQLPINNFAHKAANGRRPLAAGTGTARSARRPRRASGWPRVRPTCCRLAISMSSSPCRPRSPRSPSTTRR